MKELLQNLLEDKDIFKPRDRKKYEEELDAKFATMDIDKLKDFVINQILYPDEIPELSMEAQRDEMMDIARENISSRSTWKKIYLDWKRRVKELKQEMEEEGRHARTFG